MYARAIISRTNSIHQPTLKSPFCSCTISPLGSNQPAVAMRLRAGLASSKLTHLPRSSTTGWTTDSEYLFWGEFFFHSGEIMPQNQRIGMVNLAQSIYL